MLTSVDAAYKAEKAKALTELGTDANSAEAKLYATALRYLLNSKNSILMFFF